MGIIPVQIERHGQRDAVIDAIRRTLWRDEWGYTVDGHSNHAHLQTRDRSAALGMHPSLMCVRMLHARQQAERARRLKGR